MVLAFLWSWSRCPHDPADSDRVLCINYQQVSCRTVTYSELCKNPSIRRRQGQNKTHCCIHLGVFLAGMKIIIFHLYGSLYGRNVFVVFHLFPTIYRNTGINVTIVQIARFFPSLCRHRTPFSFPRATLIASHAMQSQLFW